MKTTYKFDKSHYYKQKRQKLLYLAFNSAVVALFLWFFYENFTATEFFERLKFDYQLILFLIAVFFCFVHYSTWQDLRRVDLFSELHISEVEIVQSTGLIDERIKVSDIANIAHNRKEKSDEHILIELTNGQFIVIAEYKEMSKIFRDLRSVWRK